MNNTKIAVIAYTEYSRDPRVRRSSEALAMEGYSVDCYVLSEENEERSREKNGVHLTFLPVNQFMGSSNLKYMLSYLNFFFKILYMFSMTPQNRCYKVIHYNNMPNFIIFALLIPKLFGTKLILDIHDNMPELYRTKFSNIFSTFIFYILLFEEKISTWMADIIFATHIPHKEFLINEHGIDSGKMTEIVNFADQSLFHPIDNNRKEKDIFKLMYHGTIAQRFGLELIVKELRLVRDLHENISFDVYGSGDGVEELKKSIVKYGMGKVVKYHGKVNLDEIPNLIANADLGVVSYIKTDATELMLPLKLFEYISMEIPVMTVRNKAISHYFTEDDLEYFSLDNPGSFKNNLLTLLKDKKRQSDLIVNVRKLKKKYNWETERSRYINIIKELIDEKI